MCAYGITEGQPRNPTDRHALPSAPIPVSYGTRRTSAITLASHLPSSASAATTLTRPRMAQVWWLALTVFLVGIDENICSRHPSRDFARPECVDGICQPAHDDLLRCLRAMGFHHGRVALTACSRGRLRLAADRRCERQAESGTADVHLISSRQTLDLTALTPGMRISVSSRKSDKPFRSRATTLST